MHFYHLIHLGDLGISVALASAISIWLLVARAYSSACRWCVTYGSVMGTVAISKIGYVGWGLQISALEFKALSGHAAAAATTLPIAFYLAAECLGKRRQALALLAGWLISIGIVLALVRYCEHTPSEAMGGWCLGLMASRCMWINLRRTLIRSSWPAAAGALAMAMAAAGCMHAIPVNRWMIEIALSLSGAQRPHPWNQC